MKPLGRTALILLLGCLLLSVGLLLRATTFTSRQVSVPATEQIHVDTDAAAARLGAALRFKTISHQDPAHLDREAFVGFHGYLAQTFGGVQRRLQREVMGDFSLLYRWAGTDGDLPPLLLLAHLDVVPAPDAAAWTHPPFSGTVADGYVWGRGALDDKVAVLGVLEAVERLLQDEFVPRRTVLLAFGHDEEVGGRKGAAPMAARLAELGVRPVMILDEGLAVLEGIIPAFDRPVAMVGVAEKGYLTLELTAQGAGGHSAMPPKQTSVGILSSAIRALESKPMPVHLDGPVDVMFQFLAPELPLRHRMMLANLWLFRSVVALMLDDDPPMRALIRTTLAPTMLEGSVKDNVLPKQARAMVNVRVHPADRIEEVLAHVDRTIADPRVTVRVAEGTVSEPSGISPVDSPAFAVLQRTIAEQFRDVVVAPSLVLGATDSRHYRALSPHIYRFIPMRVSRQDTQRIHGIDERLAVDNYAEIIAFYGGLIRALCQ